MAENRLLGADFVRAVACFTVLFHHLAQRMKWDADLGPGIEWFRGFAQMGTFGVAMFFVLSGFLLARPFWKALDAGDPMPSLGTYALRRGARILPGFWLALTVTLVLSVTIFGARLDAEVLLRYLSGFLLVADWHWVTFFPVEVNGPLWSISFEATSYLLLPLGLAALFAVRGLTGRGWQSRGLWLGVIGVVLVAHLLFMQVYPIDNSRRGWDYGLIGGAKWWMPKYNPLAFFAMFAIGALAAGMQVRWGRIRHWAFDVASLAAIAATLWVIYLQLTSRADASGFGWLDIPYAFPWFQVTIAAFLATSPSSVLVGRLLDNPVTRYLATVSFGIYVWHYVVLELVRKFWAPDIDHGSMADPVKFVVVSGVITALSIAVAHMSFHLLENPVMQWARRREKGGNASATLSPAAG